MFRPRILLAIGALATAAVLFIPPVAGALATRRAAGEARLEEAARSADIRFLEERVAADPDNWLLAGHLADLYAARFRAASDPDDIVLAERLVRRTLALRPDPAGGWARLSSLLLAQHRFREGYDAARLAVAERPREEALAAFVDAARAIGDDVAADSALARLTPGTFAFAVRTPGALAPEDAVQQVARACARLDERGSPRDLRAWCLTRLATLEIERGLVKAGRARLERALEIDPDNRGALETAAVLAYSTAEWHEARRLFGRILSDAHPDLYLRLAEVDRRLRRFDEATMLERRFVRLVSDPARHALFGLELALFHARRGQCGRALPLAGAELTRRHSIEALEGVAWVHFQCGDSRHAEELLRRTGPRMSATGEYLAGLLLRERTPEAAVLPPATTAERARLAHYAVLHHVEARSGSM